MKPQIKQRRIIEFRDLLEKVAQREALRQVRRGKVRRAKYALPASAKPIEAGE